MRAWFVAAAIGLALAVVGVLAAGPVTFVQASTAKDSVEDWKPEFDDVCSKTEDAMAFTVDELKRLVSRCDALMPSIQALEGTQKKVYLKRLQSCKDLFLYVIQVKEQKK